MISWSRCALGMSLFRAMLSVYSIGRRGSVQEFGKEEHYSGAWTSNIYPPCILMHRYFSFNVGKGDLTTTTSTSNLYTACCMMLCCSSTCTSGCYTLLTLLRSRLGQSSRVGQSLDRLLWIVFGASPTNDLTVSDRGHTRCFESGVSHEQGKPAPCFV